MKKNIILLFTIFLILSSSFSYANNLDNILFELNSFYTYVLPKSNNLNSIHNLNNFIENNNVSGKLTLGNERIFSDFSYLIDNKNIGIVTNQTGLNSKKEKTVNLLYNYPKTNLVSIYSPEHGLDGKAKAGAYVDSYIDENLNLPVYSLYGKTREPSTSMLKDIDVILFDMQDIGSRTYTYISTLNYVMKSAAKNNIKVVVLDRPNPLGGEIVDGYIAKDKYLTFVGVDNLPIQHGMTVGELALFFNRKINCDLVVVPMKNYSRNMIWQDTKLEFVGTSPNIPNITSAFGYIATGMGEGTSVGQGDKFTWVGSSKINSNEFAQILNSYSLEGVYFSPEQKNSRGGVRLNITNYKTFNPTKTAIYILTTANNLKKLNIPKENNRIIPMFEKIWGSNEFGIALENKYTAEEVIQSYQIELENFKQLRKQYLIYK